MLYLTVFILTIICFGVNCQDSSDNLIVGGTNAYAGQAPYQVSLRDPNNNHFCGGAIITSRWVVTAAHCCVNAGYPTFIVAGSILLDSGGVRYDVNKSIIHEYYSQYTNDNDIALVELKTLIEFSVFVDSVSLPIFPIMDNKPLLASGWGYTSVSGTKPNTLQVLTTTTMSRSDCLVKWNGYNIYDSNLCVYVAYGKGLCNGDSGGPVTKNGKLHGIVSWGKPCAVGYPDVLTRVSSYVGWMSWTLLQN